MGKTKPETTPSEGWVYTDWNTLAIFDASVLERRLEDDEDWWQYDGVSEMNEVNAVFVTVDAHVSVYRESPPDVALSNTVSAVVRCESGTLYIHGAEEVPSDEVMTTIKNGGLCLEFAPGIYWVTLLYRIKSTLDIYITSAEEKPENAFDEFPSMDRPPRTAPKDRAAELVEKLEACESVKVTGLVGPGGLGGSQRLYQRSLGFSLVAWRIDGRTTETTEFYVRKIVSQEEYDRLRSQLRADATVRLELRVASEDDEYGKRQALLVELIDPAFDDEEMSRILEEHKTPRTFVDNELGEFTYGRSLGGWKTTTRWCDVEGIDLTLYPRSLGGHRKNADLDAGLVAALATARDLWGDAIGWNKKFLSCLAEQVLSLKNESWLNDGERELTRAEFESRIRLRSISVHFFQRDEIWLMYDTDLFFGHDISIKGNVRTGNLSASLEG